MAKRTGGGERIRIAKGIHIYRRPDSPAWQADIVHRNSRTRASLGTTDQVEARTRAIAEAARIHSENRRLGDYSFAEALAAWTTYAPRSSRETSMVARLVELHGDADASEVDEGSLMTATSSLSAAYANRILNIARAALRLAARHGKIPAAPMIGRRPTPPGRQRFLSAEEWIRLEAELPDHLRAPVAFSIETGLRRENALRLRWRQVDLRRATAFVEAIRSKSRVAIPVPLSPKAVAILRAEEGKHPEFVFTREAAPTNRPGEYVPIGDPKKAWKAAVARAKITDFKWHDNRHTWASWHTMNGTRPEVLRDLGGWASLDMVERYAHLEPGHLRQFAGGAGSGLAAAVKRVPKKRRSAA